MNPWGVIVLIVILIGLGAVTPILLRWLAQKNRRQHREAVRQMPQLDGAMRTVRRELSAFSGTQSQEYQSHYRQAQQIVQEIKAHQVDMRRAWQPLTFPQVPDGRWPGRFFVNHPRHLISIPRTALALRRIQEETTVAQDKLSDLYHLLDVLDSLPTLLREQYQDLYNNDLAAIQVLIDNERQAQITALGDWEDTLVQLQTDVGDLYTPMTHIDAATIREWDTIANRLEALRERVGSLTRTIREQIAERKDLDERISEMEAALNTLPTDGLPDAVTTLIQYAGALITAAYQQRQQRRYTEANRFMGVSEQAVGLVSVLYQNEMAIRNFAQHALQSPVADHFADIEIQHDYLLQAVPPLISGDVIPIPEDVPAQLTDAIRQAKRIVRQITILQSDYQNALAAIQETTDGQARAMVNAWELLQVALPLNTQDPLAIEYERLEAANSGAHQHYATLQYLTTQMQTLTAQLEQTTEDLRARRSNLRRTLDTIPEAFPSAELEADGWHCLYLLAESIREQVAEIEATGTEIENVNRVAEAYQIFNSVETLVQDARQDFQTLVNQRHQILQFNRSIAESRNLLDSSSEDLSPSRVRRVLNRVEYDYNEAAKAASFDDAVVMLQRIDTDLRNLIYA